MASTRLLDFELIKRLESAKQSYKSKLYHLSIEELITLPLKKNKVIQLFDDKGNPVEKNIRLINDLIYTKIQDRVSFRDEAYKNIVQEGLGIRNVEDVKICSNLDTEWDFVKQLVSKKNFPKQLESILKEPIKQPKGKSKKNKKKEFNNIYDTFIDIRDYVNENSKMKNSTNLDRLRSVSIHNELEVFPSNKWLYGVKRIKQPKSTLENIRTDILKLKKEYGSKWNEKDKLDSIILNDVTGMWFISKERIDINDDKKYHNTNISKLKNYIFDQSALEVDKNSYANKYRDPTTDSDSIRMYIKPTEKFMKKTGLKTKLYSSYIKELTEDNLRTSVHLQGIYAAVKNKFYGRGAHAIYKHKKNIKENKLFEELDSAGKAKQLEHEYKLNFLIEPIGLIR